MIKLRYLTNQAQENNDVNEILLDFNKKVIKANTMTFSDLHGEIILDNGCVKLNESLGEMFKLFDINDRKIEDDFILLIQDDIIYEAPIVNNNAINFNKIKVLSTEIILNYNEFMIYRDSDGDYVYYTYVSSEDDFSLMEIVQDHRFAIELAENDEIDNTIKNITSNLTFDVCGESSEPIVSNESYDFKYVWFKFCEDDGLESPFDIID